MKTPIQLIRAIYNRLYYYCAPDKIYLNKKFKKVFGRDIDWKNPITFNEKLQWLKVYDRNPLYTRMVDKYEVRNYIAEKIGEQYLVPCLGVWNSFEEIDFNLLPNEFVLKCTHDSASYIICRNKEKLNFEIARKKLTGHLHRNFYYNAREWPYKNVKPRIIAEKYMGGGTVLTDYKFFCFNGIPRFMYISQDAGQEPHTDFFDMDFNRLPIHMKDPNYETPPEKPEMFEQMREIATIFSHGIPHLRVDFYVIDSKLYIGELTFYHCSGFAKIHPCEWDEIIGDYLVLPKKRKLTCNKTGQKVH